MNKKAERYIAKSMKMNHTLEGDVVMTPEPLAIDIINHFNPKGLVLDPCKGTGAFYNNFPGEKDWCEISEGKDFFDYTKEVEWIITNPPFSNMVPFLIHGMEVANNVVYYQYIDRYWTKARINIIQEMGFGLRELYMIDPPKGSDFPKFGRALAAIHLKKGWNGDVIINKLVY
jgi:hypothetical protein